MTDDNDTENDLNGDIALASEYVLGVLEKSEREAVETRLISDRAFASLVESWEIHLADFNGEFSEITPPKSVKDKLDWQLFGPGAVKPMNGSLSLWKSLTVWRALFAATAAGLIALLVFTYYGALLPGDTLVATLSAKGSETEIVALYDTRAGDLRISLANSQKATDQDYELWLISEGDAPVSLGLIGREGAGKPVVSGTLIAKYKAGATLAVSLEALGGSPTGAPTGPVIAAGVLKKI